MRKRSSSFSRWHDKFETATNEQVIEKISQFLDGKNPFGSMLEESCYKEKYEQIIKQTAQPGQKL